MGGGKNPVNDFEAFRLRAKRIDLKQAQRWIDRAYKKRRPIPEPFTRDELLQIREERRRRDVTHTEAWFIHTSAMPVEHLAAFFCTTPATIRKLQQSPNAGKPLSRAELAALGPGLRSLADALRADQRKLAEQLR